jgi:hypothetical protein
MLPARHKDPASAPVSVDYAYDHMTLSEFKHLASSTLADKKTTFVR